jgi:hypothetical protein
VATYKAKSPAVGKPRVRVRRRGSNAIVTWSRASLGNRYDVFLVYGSGDRKLVQPRGKTRRVLARGVRKGEGLVVTVQAISKAGRRGRTGRARLAGSLLFGKVKKTPPYRPKKKKTTKRKKLHVPADGLAAVVHLRVP